MIEWLFRAYTAAQLLDQAASITEAYRNVIKRIPRGVEFTASTHCAWIEKSLRLSGLFRDVAESTGTFRCQRQRMRDENGLRFITDGIYEWPKEQEMEKLDSTRFTWTNPDTGEEYPLYEADYDMAYTVYKKDKKRSIIGSPTHCIEAEGICASVKGAIAAWIGCGKDAYVLFEPTSTRPVRHAVHFTIPAKAARVRDFFDQKGSPSRQVLTLRAPTPGRTREAREEMGRKRRTAVKAGAPVKPRGAPRRTRFQRLGVSPRPKPIVRRVSPKEAKRLTEPWQ